MKTIYFLIMMLVVAFTSCNKDNNSDEIYPTESLLSVKTDLGEMLSRAAMPSGSEMGLYITSGSLGSVYDNTTSNNNVKAVLSGSVWTLPLPCIYPQTMR